MGLGKRSRKKGLEKRVQEDSYGSPRETLASALEPSRVKIPEGYVEVERYPLNPPFCYAVITQDEDSSDHLYIVDELPMDGNEVEAYRTFRNLLEHELKAPTETETLSFHQQIESIVQRHSGDLPSISGTGLKKVLYYLERDILGFERMDPLMRDPNAEDVSCGGIGKPLFLWHRNYESIRTNVLFENEQALDDFIMKQVHRAGKHVSTAFPVVDVTLPGKHRLAVLYRRELTPLGTSFTVRKFREDPYTIIDLINMGTLDRDLAAYFWLLLENKMSLMILGSTGAGKTTALNAVTCLIQPASKIFTVEEVAEINLPHENWFTLVARSGFGLESEGQIGLFDLIKSGVRHRPDFIIVGEVRGDEAYVLFQALATGHGGLCTMHADTADSAVKRLTQKPMNIPPQNIPLMNCLVVIKRVSSPAFSDGGRRVSSRRVVQVAENLDENSVEDISVWNPASDSFSMDVKSSELLRRIATTTGYTHEEILQEFERRKVVLQWMSDQRIRDYRKVSQVVSSYHQDPERIYKKALGVMPLQGIDV